MKCPFNRFRFCEKGRVFAGWVRRKAPFSEKWLRNCVDCNDYPDWLTEEMKGWQEPLQQSSVEGV